MASVSSLLARASEAHANAEGEASRESKPERIDTQAEILVDGGPVSAGTAAPVLVDLGVHARIGCPQGQVTAGCGEREIAQPELPGVGSRHVVCEAQLPEAQELAVLVLVEAVVGRERLQLVRPRLRGLEALLGG